MRKAVSIATLLALPLLAAAFSGCASTPAADARVSSEAYLADVAWLADDARQGRDTDSPELRLTAEWVSERFDEAGLLPLGDDGGWLQHFTVKGQRRLLDGNALRLGDEELELRRDWIPLQTAMSAAVEGDVVFAGYGISDPEGGYDDYAGLDAKDKLVLVLRRGPQSGVEGSRYNQNGPGGSHIGLATKVNAAFRHGAKGLLAVNGPRDFEPGSRADRVMRYGPLGEDATTASLPSAQLSARSTLETLAAHGLDLAATQKAIDESLQPQSRPIAGLSAALTIAADEEQIDTVNVLGLLPGNDPSLADEYVLVGAHMDHVGLGMHAGSRGGPEARGQVHNGADDNASGTAGTIEAARLLGAHPEGLRRSIVFATWSGEEWGLLGSQHFVEHPALPLAHCVAVINMDMIGRSKNGYLSVEGVGTSPGFKDLVLDTEQQLGLGLDVALADRPADNSDQASFFVKDIPVLNFFTGLHDDYHMPSDDVDKINADAGANIATLAGRVAQKLAVADGRPVFTPLAPPQDAVASAHAAPGGPGASPPRDGAAPVPYRVVLGTSPDMGYEKDDGVRISSVRPGTPAEKAGLLKGDRIVALDGVEIRTLQDYSTLLFSHKPGDQVVVSVVRGEQKLDLTATLEGKAGDA
jgi:hypothetical protein